MIKFLQDFICFLITPRRLTVSLADVFFLLFCLGVLTTLNAVADDCYHFHQWTICENEWVVCWVDRTIGMDSLHCEHKVK